MFNEDQLIVLIQICTTRIKELESELKVQVDNNENYRSLCDDNRALREDMREYIGAKQRLLKENEELHKTVLNAKNSHHYVEQELHNYKARAQHTTLENIYQLMDPSWVMYNKISAIKAVRYFTNSGLREAKDTVESSIARNQTRNQVKEK